MNIEEEDGGIEEEDGQQQQQEQSTPPNGYIVQFDADGADRCQVNVIEQGASRYVHFVSPSGMRYRVDVT